MPTYKDPEYQQRIMNRLAATIRIMREKQHLSIRQFADKCGIPHSDIARLENGTTKNPSIFLIRKIGETLGLSVDELMNFDAEPCPTCSGSGFVLKKAEGDPAQGSSSV